MTPTAAPTGETSNRLAYLVVIAGVVAGLHVWKLPPSLPVLQAQLGLTLVESGFLLSMVQSAGMFLGLVVGLFAEKIGLRRCVLIGLTLLSIGSFLAPTIDMRIA
ncbi:MAG TPA: TetR family transcriptional regulator, partial [Pusillimonas sp.]|nr:TetR family transcriptional regulator [Pusillimonas sp.]